MPSGVYKRRPEVLALKRAACRTPQNRERARRSALRSWSTPRIRKKFLLAAKKRIPRIAKSVAKSWKNKSVRFNHVQGVKFVRLLWQSLSSLGYQREFHIAIRKNYKPEKHGHWFLRIDFALPEQKIAIECDGPRHFYLSQKSIDRKRDQILHRLGWKVIRVQHD